MEPLLVNTKKNKGAGRCPRPWSVLVLLTGVLLTAGVLNHLSPQPLRADSEGMTHHPKHIVRRWHQVSMEYADEAAIATVVGVGIHVAGRTMARMFQNVTDSDARLRRLYRQAIQEQKDMQQEFQRKYAALREKNHKDMLELKQSDAEKLLQAKSVVELREKEIDEMKRRAREAEEQSAKAKDETAKAQSQLETVEANKAKAEKDAEEARKAASGSEKSMATIRSEMQDLKHSYQKSVSKASSLEDDLAKAKAALAAASADAAAAKSSNGSFPWKSIMGATGAAGLAAGIATTVAHKRGDGTAGPPLTPGPPKEPPMSIFSYDSPLGTHDSVVQVEPCPPCRDDAETWDWKLLVIGLESVIIVLLLCYICLAPNNKPRMEHEMDKLLTQIAESQHRLANIDSDSDEILDHLESVQKMLGKMQDNVKAMKELEQGNDGTQDKDGEEENKEEGKELKAERTNLQQAVDQCLKDAVVEEVTEDGEQMVNCYNFVKGLTSYGEYTDSEDVRATVESMKQEFKQEEPTLDKTITTKWQGNYFDEIQFYLHNLQHVEVPDTERKQAESHPVVEDASKKGVNEIAEGFEKAALANRPQGDQRPARTKKHYKPAKRLKTLFRSYMDKMKTST